MSIITRPKSPVWCCDFWFNGIRYQMPTPYTLEYKRGVICRGPQYDKAKAWEADQKKKIRESGGELLKEKKEAPEPTIREMFDAYIASCGDDLTNRANIETYLNMMH